MNEEINGAVEMIGFEEVEKIASYYGSKRKWAKLIVDKYFPEGTQSMLDPTAGMAWVPMEALSRGMTVYLNEVSPVAFHLSRGMISGEPVDIDEFLNVKPVKGRMSQGYGKAPREVANHIDGLILKAQKMEGAKGWWAQALVANVLTWGMGSHQEGWTAYDDPRWKPAMTWEGTSEIMRRSHEAMKKLRDRIKGKSNFSNGDVRDFKWKDVDVVFLDPPYFGSGMTKYSNQYKKLNAVLLQQDEPLKFDDLDEDDFFKYVLPKAIEHSKRVILCYPAKRSIGRRLSSLGHTFRSASLPKKLTGATVSSNRAEGGALDSNTRVYLIEGARKSGVKKSATRAWLLGTRGEGINISQGDPQAVEAAKLGNNYPHRGESSFMIDDGRARILVDLGPSLGYELDTIKPDAIIITRGSGLAGLQNFKESGSKAIVFVPKSVKHENMIPEKNLRLYEPGDMIRVPDLPDVMTFDTGDGVGIHYKEYVYTPNVGKLGGFDAHLKQHGAGGGGTTWIVDGLGLGPHRGKTGEPRVKGHPTLKEILETAKRTGVSRVVLTNIGRHGLSFDDFKARIHDLSRESGVSVSVGEDELDLREVKLSSEGESLFVKDAYNPRRVTDAQLSDDFRLVAAKYSTMQSGGATEFEDEEELLEFNEKLVAEILKRDKITFNFKAMKPKSRDLIRKTLRRIVMTGIQFSGPISVALVKDKVVKYLREDGVKFQGFNYIISADDPKYTAYGFVRFSDPKKEGDEFSYEIRDLIPFDEPIKVDLRGVKKNGATLEISLVEKGLNFKEGDKGNGVIQTHERGLDKDQIKLTTPYGWEPFRPSSNDYNLLDDLASGDWRGAVESAGQGKADKLNSLLKKIDRTDLDSAHRKALARVDPISIHTDIRLQPSGDNFFEGATFFTPGNQFAENKIRQLAKGALDETSKVLGDFKGGKGSATWLKVGDRSPAIIAPGDPGATSEAFARIVVRDKVKWIAGIQDKSFKEFWFDGKTIKGRWIFQFVPVSRFGGERRAWMGSRPKDQKMKSEKAQAMIGQR